MGTPVAPRDIGLGAGCVVFVLIWYGFRAVADLATIVVWCVIGVCCWCYAFNVQGRLGTRADVEDNIRVARHKGFLVLVLCAGSVLVLTVEAATAFYVTPWYLQVLANAALSLGSFALGMSIFGGSHEWVLMDPKLDLPLFLLDTCVVS